jgi:hypothetical protein
MHVFVGKPIPVEKRGQPTKNEVWYYFAVKNKI